MKFVQHTNHDIQYALMAHFVMHSAKLPLDSMSQSYLNNGEIICAKQKRARI